ncbi:MAG TPA: DUF3025 domain-containing protein, partial [Rhodocyclaceae bacterium]|nr:DUF3025 domain-containing protein [Rhodocyclaceae bacterium]
MTASFLEKIDWSRPWLAHVRTAGQAIAVAPDWRAELNRRAAEADLRNHRGLPIRFVPQAELPPGVAYEMYISQTGGVPTRENLHDFFNALVWLTFPKIKVQLNALQASEIEKWVAQKMSSQRGSLRDAATIFDENAVLLITTNGMLINALRRHQWTEVFITHRQAFMEECRVYLFGHALMEKLVLPYKAITGHMYVLLCPPAEEIRLEFAQFDDLFATQMSDG